MPQHLVQFLHFFVPLKSSSVPQKVKNAVSLLEQARSRLVQRQFCNNFGKDGKAKTITPTCCRMCRDNQVQGLQSYDKTPSLKTVLDTPTHVCYVPPPCPDLPFLVFLEFLAFFFCKEFQTCLSVFQRKTKGQQLKGKIVLAPFHTLSRFSTLFQKIFPRTSLKIKALKGVFWEKRKEKDQTILHVSCCAFVLL